MFCQRNKRGVCKQCGKASRRLRRCGKPVQPRTKPTPQPPCLHRGEQTRVELVECKTCRGRVRVKHPVHQCDIYHECLPTYRGEPIEGLAKCANCENYQANAVEAI